MQAYIYSAYVSFVEKVSTLLLKKERIKFLNVLNNTVEP